MMVSAVLLLIVAADLLVNGLGVQEATANVASAMPVSGRSGQIGAAASRG